MTGPVWTIAVSAAAEADFFDILRWTVERFGSRQAAAYGELLADAVAARSAGPGARGARPRAEIGGDLYTLSVRRNKRRGRHFILFRARAGAADRTVEVLRILHDAMDLGRHAPPTEVRDPET